MTNSTSRPPLLILVVTRHRRDPRARNESDAFNFSLRLIHVENVYTSATFVHHLVELSKRFGVSRNHYVDGETNGAASKLIVFKFPCPIKHRDSAIVSLKLTLPGGAAGQQLLSDISLYKKLYTSRK